MVISLPFAKFGAKFYTQWGTDGTLLGTVGYLAKCAVPNVGIDGHKISANLTTQNIDLLRVAPSGVYTMWIIFAKNFSPTFFGSALQRNGGFLDGAASATPEQSSKKA